MKTALILIGFGLIIGGAIYTEKTNNAIPIMIGMVVGTLLFIYTNK